AADGVVQRRRAAAIRHVHELGAAEIGQQLHRKLLDRTHARRRIADGVRLFLGERDGKAEHHRLDRKSTRLNSSHVATSYAVLIRPLPASPLFPYTTLFRSWPPMVSFSAGAPPRYGTCTNLAPLR